MVCDVLLINFDLSLLFDEEVSYYWEEVGLLYLELGRLFYVSLSIAFDNGPTVLFGLSWSSWIELYKGLELLGLLIYYLLISFWLSLI